MTNSTTYSIYEKQNFNSFKEADYKKQFKSLNAAKRFASMNQAFFDTVLVVERNSVEIAKKKSGKWVDLF